MKRASFAHRDRAHALLAPIVISYACSLRDVLGRTRDHHLLALSAFVASIYED